MRHFWSLLIALVLSFFVCTANAEITADKIIMRTSSSYSWKMQDGWALHYNSSQIWFTNENDVATIVPLSSFPISKDASLEDQASAINKLMPDIIIEHSEFVVTDAGYPAYLFSAHDKQNIYHYRCILISIDDSTIGYYYHRNDTFSATEISVIDTMLKSYRKKDSPSVSDSAELSVSNCREVTNKGYRYLIPNGWKFETVIDKSNSIATAPDGTKSVFGSPDDTSEFYFTQTISSIDTLNYWLDCYINGCVLEESWLETTSKGASAYYFVAHNKANGVTYFRGVILSFGTKATMYFFARSNQRFTSSEEVAIHHMLDSVELEGASTSAQTINATPKPTSKLSPTPKPTPTPQPFNISIRERAKTATIRETPSSDGHALGKVKKKDTLLALDTVTSEGETWYKVKFRGKIGYIKADYCAVIK